MTQSEVTQYQREVVLVHKQWKDAVAINDAELATTLDAQCRQLRSRIVAAKRSANPKPSAE